MELPVRALIAKTEVTVPVRSTKTRLAFARMKWGISEKETIPASGNRNAEKTNKDSVIDMVYPLYSNSCCFSGDLQQVPY